MSKLISAIKPRGVSHQPEAPTLQVKNVWVAYTAGSSANLTLRSPQLVGEKYALENISLELSAGQRVAVVGPNGAGKSTLFKLIVGTVRPSHGSVHVYGSRPAGHTCIAYVPQRSEIDWSFPVTVKDVVMMGRVDEIGLFKWPRQHDWAVVRECLEKVGAGHLADKQIGELSGGQQQRVFVARALAQHAELLLMDEPLSGLDAPSRDAMFEILGSLHREGVTILVATHDLDLAAEQFDRIVLLNRRMIAFGPPSEVLDPSHLLQAYGGRPIK